MCSFDRINTVLLFTCIKDQLKDAELRRIIWAWLEAETVVVERQGLWRKREARGLLQGGILSPLFANVYLDRFDKMALKQGLKLVRYADDCLFCCRSQAEAEATLGAAHKFLARLDLEVNPRKTAIYHAEKGLYYLGERLMLKKRGPYEELVHVRRERPGKAASPLAAPLALPAAVEPMTTQEERWEPSTSPNKAP